ncbi:hypothetical protein WN48_11375 [Eufriesea mexicana]|uniref:Uncharacterized protein n=1 Tax=Eufriesea mexicana TaxID=516756 RepID=A0A310SMT1_9HYME|nr:hypothetical protein WN48_11375 [Eufriesea mexicana]
MGERGVGSEKGGWMLDLIDWSRVEESRVVARRILVCLLIVVQNMRFAYLLGDVDKNGSYTSGKV